MGSEAAGKGQTTETGKRSVFRCWESGEYAGYCHGQPWSAIKLFRLYWAAGLSALPPNIIKEESP